MGGEEVRSGQTFYRISWVGSGQCRFAGSGLIKVTRGQLWDSSISEIDNA